MNAITLSSHVVVARCPLPPGWGIEVAVTLVKGDKLAVVDTGVADFMPAAIEPALAALGCGLADIDLIVDTHGHWDHVQGNAALKAASGAAVCIPAGDAGALTPPPDRRLADGESLDLGGLTLQIVAAPGHSPGLGVVYIPELRLLVASDAAQGHGLPGSGVPLYFHSGQQYRASLERLGRLAVDTLVVGHDFFWSGAPAMVHHGADAARFLADSLDASRRVADAALGAATACPDADWGCLQAAFVERLAAVPFFPVDPAEGLHRLAQGTLRSELRDLDIEP